MLDYFRRKRQRRLRSAPFPDEWDALLRRRVYLYEALPAHLRRELQGWIQIFLADKIFEGCNGFIVTDEVRVIIAAQASLLLLNRDVGCYPKLYTILVYPNEFVAPIQEHHDHIVTEDRRARSGEAWSRGTVILSWEDIEIGLDDSESYNVVVHEFAHYFDEETGEANGAPFLDDRSEYEEWARVFQEAYRRHRRESRLGYPTVLDPYGADDPAEFFAVATEAFFESPGDLKRDYPDLYGQLRRYYRQDPVEYYPQPEE